MPTWNWIAFTFDSSGVRSTMKGDFRMADGGKGILLKPVDRFFKKRMEPERKCRFTYGNAG